MPKETRREPAHHRLYGRAKGKPLTAYQSDLMERVYPEMEFSSVPEGELWMEIGFGAAHHLIETAKANPDITLLGAEPFLNGVAKAVAQAHEQNLTNIALHMGNAREILAQLPDASLSRLFVLYPDPWPKSRHNKRRIVQEDTIAEFARVLKPGSTWRFVSDIADYVDWVLVRVARSPAFTWSPRTASDFLTPPEDWVETQFERKAKREGRTPHYLDFTRS